MADAAHPATNAAAMTGGVSNFPAVSMIVAWNECLRHALIFDRWFQNHALRELVDHGALDFLPRRLARRIMVSAILLQCCSTISQFGRRDQNISRPLVEIDTHAIPCLQQ